MAKRKRYKVFLGKEFFVWVDRYPEPGTVIDVPGESRAAANGAVQVEVTAVDRERTKRSGEDTVVYARFEPHVYPSFKPVQDG